MVDKETNTNIPFTITDRIQRIKSTTSAAFRPTTKLVSSQRRKQIAIAYSPFRYNPLQLEAINVTSSYCSHFFNVPAPAYPPSSQTHIINKSQQIKCKNCCSSNLLREILVPSIMTSNQAVQTTEMLRQISFAHKGTMTKTRLKHHERLTRAKRYKIILIPLI